MPILPSQPHQQRQMAESFGVDAARYDRARPRYPDAMVNALLAGLPGKSVLDVGCGTGIVARQFQAAGCEVLGVDVDERMAAFARESGVPVEVAKFEEWDPAGRTFDAVVAGQTWHWVEPAAGAAKAASVINPGGRLALFWNAFQPAPEFAEAFAEVYDRVLNAPRNPWTISLVDAYRSFMAKTTEAIDATKAFGPAEQLTFEWEKQYTRDEWLDAARTGGDAGTYQPETLEELISAIGTAIDALGGSFTMGFNTVVLTATL
ncbi:class I SAM-dependent methyltransferase [Actinocrispum sp. NPDC049592]|uniref:class I SAM-dependent methyltransferase n=1 Tax=Actinocrispum sp. NPDC049592 TaxID=3154835 RepID=UPI003432723C